MKICPHPKCGKQHNKPGIFCSHGCANSRTFTEETIKKMSDSAKKKPTGWADPGSPHTGGWEDLWFLERDFNTLGFDTKRRRVIHEQDNKCNDCGLAEWRGHLINFEIDHIDGNSQNDQRENLVALCPNCHSLTPTWRGRNKNNNKMKVDDNTLIEALNETENIRQALYQVGLAAKGANYIRAKKLLEQMDQ